MMERLTIDPASWSRTCLTETNEYLMTIAGVMVKTGHAAERHVDTLRVNLGSIQPSSGAENLDPPLLTLSRKNCEFVQLLDARYGYDRLVLNLFHYSAKNWIHSTAALLNR